MDYGLSLLRAHADDVGCFLVFGVLVADEVSARAGALLAGTGFIAATYVSIVHRGLIAGAALAFAGAAAYSAATAQTGAVSPVLLRPVTLLDVLRAHR